MSVIEFAVRHAYPGGFSLDLAFRSTAMVTALFGPSGSGKTSVLEMIAGLRRPGWGRIAVGDETLFDSDARLEVPVQRRRIGMVFQDLLLWPHLSVERNLRYSRRQGDGAGPRIEFGRVTELLELGPLLARRPGALSGGERQRVAIGRALLSAPRLLVLDEPLTALDEALKHRILTCIERIVVEFAMPVLLVSHNRAEVRRLAGQVIVLDRGRAVAQSAPGAAGTHPGELF